MYTFTLCYTNVPNQTTFATRNH